MTPIAHFKLQAKNLHKDYKTKSKASGDDIYTYDPKYFDIDSIVVDFDLDEDNFTLMNAQHIIAYLAGFEKWNELIKASETKLKLAKLLFDNAHKISIDEWDIYIGETEDMNNTIYDDEMKLAIFEAVFVSSEDHQTMFIDYRLSQNLQHVIKNERPQETIKTVSDVQITSLPLSKDDRIEFVDTANSVFESVMRRMEPRNPELTRKLWKAEDYIDNGLLTEDTLIVCV